MDQLTQHLTIAELSTHDLIRIMDTLLDASAAAAGALIQQLEPGGVAFDLLARQAVEHAQQRTSRHAITLKSPAGPLLVTGDQVRLRQVLDNLLANAVKYAPDGGPITVHLEISDALPASHPDQPRIQEADSSAAHDSTSAVDQQSWSHHRFVEGAGLPQRWAVSKWLLIRITDAGLGIPAAAVPHVFDRYWRAGGATAHIRGTGLGLYACRAIVAAHGGHIWVEQSVQATDDRAKEAEWHGTVIALLLPLASSSSWAEANGRSTEAQRGLAVD